MDMEMVFEALWIILSKGKGGGGVDIKWNGPFYPTWNFPGMLYDSNGILSYLLYHSGLWNICNKFKSYLINMNDEKFYTHWEQQN